MSKRPSIYMSISSVVVISSKKWRESCEDDTWWRYLAYITFMIYRPISISNSSWYMPYIC